MNKTTLMIISTLIAAPAIQGRTINYPAARTVDTVDVYFGTQVADPYRWLEDDNSARPHNGSRPRTPSRATT